MVWRRLITATDTSQPVLYFIFQIAQCWGDHHLHQFHIYGKDYAIHNEGGIGFLGDPFWIAIADFAFDTGDPDPEYAPVIIRNNRLHVGCMFWQPADFSANSDGVIQRRMRTSLVIV
ncbi:IS1096 element passenger TnpR family protein [Cedecea davisae]|uniref:IS1096 element passenger TnpR family protein n=1 Tax=Cedecea davisae TaxID=158484 RepID=UPI003C6C3EB0